MGTIPSFGAGSSFEGYVDLFVMSMGHYVSSSMNFHLL